MNTPTRQEDTVNIETLIQHHAEGRAAGHVRQITADVDTRLRHGGLPAVRRETALRVRAARSLRRQDGAA